VDKWTSVDALGLSKAPGPFPEYEVYDLTYDGLNDADDQRVFQVVVLRRSRPVPSSFVRHATIVHAALVLPKHIGSCREGLCPRMIKTLRDLAFARGPGRLAVEGEFAAIGRPEQNGPFWRRLSCAVGSLHQHRIV
jgi:hypothetical protein